MLLAEAWWARKRNLNPDYHSREDKSLVARSCWKHLRFCFFREFLGVVSKMKDGHFTLYPPTVKGRGKILVGLLNQLGCADLSCLIPHCLGRLSGLSELTRSSSSFLLKPCDPADPVMCRVLSGSF